MMGRLIGYELKKSVWTRFFLAVFCLALAANFLLQCGIESYVSYSRIWEQDDPAVQAENPKQSFWEFYRYDRTVTHDLRAQYSFVAGLSPEEEQAALAALEEKYGTGVIEDPNTGISAEGIFDEPGYFGAYTDFTYLSARANLLGWNAEIDAARENVLRAAEALKKQAESDGDAYNIRRNDAVLQLYAAPRPKVTTFLRFAGKNFFGAPTMLFVFLLILVTATVSVAGEHDRQTWLLLHTARNGKGKTLLAKYISGWITAAALTAIFQLDALLALIFQGGGLYADQPAAALHELQLCPFPIKIWQYFLLSTAMQTFAAAVLSTILTTVSACSKTGVIAYMAGALILIGCLLLFYFPPRSEWLTGPLALAEPSRYLSGYYTCDFFGFPVLWAVIDAILWTLLSAGLMLFAQKWYHRERRAI